MTYFELSLRLGKLAELVIGLFCKRKNKMNLISTYILTLLLINIKYCTLACFKIICFKKGQTFSGSNKWRVRLKMLMGAQDMKKNELTRINIMFVLFFLAIFLALLMVVKHLLG